MNSIGRQGCTLAEQLPLDASWPLFDLDRHFDLGCILNSEAIDAVKPAAVGDLNYHHAGCWECDLKDNRLNWSGGVYDIFGLPRDALLTREECVAFYSERSRSVMERLRTYAIEHQCGFTLDAEINPAVGGKRWMRLIAAPVCEGGHAVRLHGIKLIIS
jgi:PAS domain-containing protein